MREKLAEYIRKLKNRIDQVVLVVFIILVVVLLLNYAKEQSATPPEIPPQSPTILDKMLPNPQYEKVVAFSNIVVDPDKAEEFKSLWEYNMFDYKTVRDKDAIQKQYDKEYTRAEEFFNKGNYTEAKEIINKILLHWPSHIKSRNLLKQIQAATQKESTEKAK